LRLARHLHFLHDLARFELVSRILERIVSLRVLLVVTFRPEFGAPWIGLPHVAAVTINRLGRGDIDAIIVRIVGNMFLPPAASSARAESSLVMSMR
jgi:hypothetical protein